MVSDESPSGQGSLSKKIGFLVYMRGGVLPAEEEVNQRQAKDEGVAVATIQYT